MSKLYISNTVIDKYLKGEKLNDALSEAFFGEINDKCKENEAFAKMTPLQILMHDAGITKNSVVGDIMNGGSTYTSGGMDNNEWLFPVWLEETIRQPIYDKDIIGELVTTTIGIEGNVVKSPTLNLMSEKNKPNFKKARIAEGADLPLAKITMGEQAISLYKHGRAVEMTYESMRRMKIPLFLQNINGIINDIAFQNLDFAVDVLVNGDGNTDSAASKLGTTANVGMIENTELIGFLMDYWFENHYAADTITTNMDMAKQIGAMFFDTNLSAGASAQVRFSMPQFLDVQNVKVLVAHLPKINGKDVIALSNRNNTLIRYEENGSNIQENSKNIRNQTGLLTVSENSGYAIGTIGSNKYIEVLS